MIALCGWFSSTKNTSLGSFVLSPLIVTEIVRVVCPGAKVSVPEAAVKSLGAVAELLAVVQCTVTGTDTALLRVTLKVS